MNRPPRRTATEKIGSPAKAELTERLVAAAEKGELGTVKRLLGRGVDPIALLNLDGTPGKHCLLLALAKTRFEGALLIWDRMDRPMRKAKLLQTLMKSSFGDATPQQMMEFAAQGAELGVAKETAASFAHEAAIRGRPHVVAALMQFFELGEAIGPNRSTELMLAVQTVLHQSDMGAILDIAKSSDLEARDAAGLTALMIAVRRGHCAAAQALLDVGADPMARDTIGRDCFEQAKDARAFGHGMRHFIASGRSRWEAKQIDPGAAALSERPRRSL